MIPTDKLYNLIIPIHTLSANVCKTAEALGSSGSFRSSGRSGTEPKSKLGSKWTWLMPAFASWRRWRSPTVPSWKLRKAPSICKLPISSNHWMSWVISKLQLSPKWYICIFWIILESVLRPGIFFSKVQHKTISTRGVFYTQQPSEGPCAPVRRPNICPSTWHSPSCPWRWNLAHATHRWRRPRLPFGPKGVESAVAAYFQWTSFHWSNPRALEKRWKKDSLFN